MAAPLSRPDEREYFLRHRSHRDQRALCEASGPPVSGRRLAGSGRR